MIKVNVLSEERSWSKKIINKEKLFNDICKNFPKKLRLINKKAYVTLLLSNNKHIKKLNKRFRNKNKHTDVLSFPFDQMKRNSKEIYLGDIIISFNYMNKPRNLTLKKFKENSIRIFIHGYLHLLGYDHIKDKDYKKMLNTEEKIFNSVKRILR